MLLSRLAYRHRQRAARPAVSFLGPLRRPSGGCTPGLWRRFLPPGGKQERRAAYPLGGKGKLALASYFFAACFTRRRPPRPAVRARPTLSNPLVPTGLFRLYRFQGLLGQGVHAGRLRARRICLSASRRAMASLLSYFRLPWTRAISSFALPPRKYRRKGTIVIPGPRRA